MGKRLTDASAHTTSGRMQVTPTSSSLVDRRKDGCALLETKMMYQLIRELSSCGAEIVTKLSQLLQQTTQTPTNTHKHTAVNKLWTDSRPKIARSHLSLGGQNALWTYIFIMKIVHKVHICPLSGTDNLGLVSWFGLRLKYKSRLRREKGQLSDGACPIGNVWGRRRSGIHNCDIEL